MSLRRALIVGASGYVGGRLLAMLGPDRAVGTWGTRPADGLVPFDVTRSRLGDLLRSLPGPFSHVVIPLGIASPDRCADDPAGTALVNVERVRLLIEDAWAQSLFPVFLSTDYVFDGTRGLRTEDEPQTPTTEYGRQKAAVEQWLQGRPEPWMVARLSKVVSGDRATHSVLGQWVNDIRCGRPMRSATDQIFSPIWLDDLCRALIELCDRGQQGILNVAGPEAMSRFELNRLLVEAITDTDHGRRTDTTLTPCRLAEIPFRHPRPLNTSLCVDRLTSLLPWTLRRMCGLVRGVADEHFPNAERRDQGST